MTLKQARQKGAGSFGTGGYWVSTWRDGEPWEGPSAPLTTIYEKYNIVCNTTIRLYYKSIICIKYNISISIPPCFSPPFPDFPCTTANSARSYVPPFPSLTDTEK